MLTLIMNRFITLMFKCLMFYNYSFYFFISFYVYYQAYYSYKAWNSTDIRYNNYRLILFFVQYFKAYLSVRVYRFLSFFLFIFVAIVVDFVAVGSCDGRVCVCREGELKLISLFRYSSKLTVSNNSFLF